MTVLYVMAANNGEVKVGYSGAPFARLSAVKKAYAGVRGFTALQLFAFVPSADPILDELAAIRALVPLATGGEWFRCSPEHALQAVVDAVWTGAGPVEVIRPRKFGAKWVDDREMALPSAHRDSMPGTR